jgi:hypothetical protein
MTLPSWLEMLQQMMASTTQWTVPSMTMQWNWRVFRVRPGVAVAAMRLAERRTGLLQQR